MRRDPRRARRGNAMIEFALSASVLLPAFAGVYQFGYSFYAYNTLQGSVRSAARYASVRSYTSSSATPSTEYATEVKNVVVYGKPVIATGPGIATAQPLLPGLSTGNIEIVVEMNGSVPRTVTVRVVNFAVDAIFQTFTFHRKPSATFWYNGTGA